MKKKDMPSVAIIMSVYISDSIDYIKIAIESILKQTYKEIHLYIYIDGPVTIEVEQFISELAAINDTITYIKSSDNKGLSYALNAMIDIIVKDGSHDYIARMDSDDISYPNRIARQVEFFNANQDVDVLGTFCHEFGADFALKEKRLPIFHSELLQFSIAKCPFIHPTVMFNISIFKNTAIRYPVSTVLTEDMALWFMLLEYGYKFSNVPEVLLDYRLNVNTLKRRQGFRKALNEFCIRGKYMFRLNAFSFKNLAFISLRLVFHVLPIHLLCLIYKYAR